MRISMIMQHNMAAMNANRQFNMVLDRKASSTEKLSSGYQINRSADNAAGLSISEKMRKQIRGLNRANENIEDGISYVQVADGALNEVHNILQRINELSVQSANGTNSETDRSYIDSEVQKLKKEMERIFTTTAFNERKIWTEDLTIRKDVIGTAYVQAATIDSPSYQYPPVNNETFGLFPISTPTTDFWTDYHKYDNSSGSYTINANATGINLSWSAFNGTHYQTKTISWDELREKNFSFNVGDYFVNEDKNGVAITDPTKQLLDANGKPKFDFSISLTVSDDASNDEIAKAMNGVRMSHSFSSPATFEDENKTLSSNNAGFGISTRSFVYSAAYADAVLAAQNQTAGYDFEHPSDSFIEPVKNASGGNITKIPNKGVDLATARITNDGWEFAFTANGLGNLTATSTQYSYYSDDIQVSMGPGGVDDPTCVGRDANDEGVFWERRYDYVTENGVTKRVSWHPVRIHRGGNTGTLQDLMSTLTGTTGLLSKNPSSGEKGGTDDGGTVFLTFDLTSDTPYVYGKDANGNDLTSNKVGTFTLNFNVTPKDTEQSILDRINKAFQDSTLFDFNFTNTNSGSIYRGNAYTSPTAVNNYAASYSFDDIALSIHSGSEIIDKIAMQYECLRLETIGMSDTNVLTEEDALAAIDEVAHALEIISSQRSLLGAYQNRMESASKIDANASENTQSAESKIRDTDMSREMVDYSNATILGEAGQSVLSQSNQANQGLLTLLR